MPSPIWFFDDEPLFDDILGENGVFGELLDGDIFDNLFY